MRLSSFFTHIFTINLTRPRDMYVNFGGNGFYDGRSLALKRCKFQVARCRFGLRKYAMPFTMFRIYVFGCEAPSKSKACRRQASC